MFLNITLLMLYLTTLVNQPMKISKNTLEILEEACLLNNGIRYLDVKEKLIIAHCESKVIFEYSTL